MLVILFLYYDRFGETVNGMPVNELKRVSLEINDARKIISE